MRTVWILYRLLLNILAIINKRFVDRGAKFFIKYLVRNYKHSEIIYFGNDLKIKLNNLKEIFQANIFLSQEYNDGAVNFIRKRLREGDNAIDVGANIGCITLQMAQLVGNTGKIIAIEADMSNFSMLKENIQLNNFKNVDAINNAVADCDNKEIKLFITRDNIGMNSMFYRDGILSKESFTILKTITLDSILESYDLRNIILIKIDVEGMEMDVMTGAKQTIKKYRPILVIEVSAELLNYYGLTVKNFKENICSFGYECCQTDRMGNLKPVKIEQFHLLEDLIFVLIESISQYV